MLHTYTTLACFLNFHFLSVLLFFTFSRNSLKRPAHRRPELILSSDRNVLSETKFRTHAQCEQMKRDNKIDTNHFPLHSDFSIQFLYEILSVCQTNFTLFSALYSWQRNIVKVTFSLTTDSISDSSNFTNVPQIDCLTKWRRVL